MDKKNRLIHRLNDLFDKIIGPPDEFSLGQRMMALMCLIIFIGGFLNIIIIILTSSPLLAIILSPVFQIIAIIYYYLTRFKKYKEEKTWHYLLFILMLASISFFYTSGIEGTSISAYFLFMIFSLFLPRKNFLYIIIIINASLLIIIDYYYPELISGYNNNESRFYDHLFATIAMGILIYLIINLFRQAYNREQEKNIAQNKALEQQKKQILQLSERERQINEMKMNFFTNLSHEFRTPLTLIKSPVEKLLEEDTEPARHKHYEIIRENMDRLNHLIDQALEFRKIDTGKTLPNLQTGDMVKFIKNVILSFRSLAERKNITLSYKPDEESYFMPIDRDKMEKVLNNIISNAFKFTPDKGTIEIKTKHINIKASEPSEKSLTEDPPCKLLEISISDTGKGIPEEYLDEIFNPYFQAPGTEYGTGLGLAIAKEYMENFDGNIKVASSPGKGCCFVLTLPVKNIDHTETVNIEDKPGKPEIKITDTEKDESGFPILETLTGNKKVILIAEDNKDIIDYLKTAFNKDFRVLAVYNGTDALRIAMEKIPHLIISDIMMPGIDGIELCKRVKLDERTCHIPVILLTAKAGEENVITGLEYGADDYIIKPFSIKEVKARAINMITQRQKLREKFSNELDAVDTRSITVSSIDEIFLNKAIRIIEENMIDPDFGPGVFAKQLGISRTLVHIKLKSLTDQSASRFISSIRLRAAARMLKENKMSISEVAYAVGYNDPPYFVKSFKKIFKKTPTEYIKS